MNTRVTKEELYDLFKNYDKPDEIDFQSLIDECYNDNDTATMEQVRAYVASAITASEASTRAYIDDSMDRIQGSDKTATLTYIKATVNELKAREALTECSESEVRGWFGDSAMIVNGEIDDNGVMTSDYTIDNDGTLTFND